MNPTPCTIIPRKSNTRNWVNTINSDSNSHAKFPTQHDSISTESYPKCISLRTNTFSRTCSSHKIVMSYKPSDISTLKHSKSFVSLRRSNQMAMQNNPACIVSNSNPVAKTRLRMVRHVIGFRNYNKVQVMEAYIFDTIESIRLLMHQPFMGLQYASDNAETSFDELQRAESNFFCVADRITRYEAKLKEIEFLKANMEKCITASIVKARQDFQSLEQSNTTEYKPMLSKLERIIVQPWRDHNQLRLCLNELKGILLPHSCLTEAFPGLALPNTEVINKLIRSVKEFSTLKNLQPKLKQVFTASVDVEGLRLMSSRLKECEIQLTSALSLEQAAASAILAFAMEARCTAYILQKRTEQISLSLTENAQRDIDAEANALYKFIYSGRECERQMIKATLIPAPHQRVFTKSLEPDRFIPPSPVWAKHWTDKTKLLKRKG